MGSTPFVRNQKDHGNPQEAAEQRGQAGLLRDAQGYIDEHDDYYYY